MTISNDFETVRRYVVARKTEKVIADVQNPVVYSNELLHHWNDVIHQTIAAAGMAPFHFERKVDQIPEPWRVHFLQAETCRRLAQKAARWFDIKPNNKIPGMLSACGCLLLVTWLPQFREISVTEEISAQKQLEVDDEHLAATAAFVQNLLVLLTSAGLGTYWSSGGFLGTSEMFQRLGIDCQERLLAALFVEFPGATGVVTERIPGKNRSIRTPKDRWTSVRNLCEEDE